MQFETCESEKIKLKHSCEGCISLKAKCDSLKPICSRCIKRGSECVYLPQKKRGRKKTNKKQTKKAALTRIEEDFFLDLFKSDLVKLKLHDFSFSKSQLLENTGWRLMEQFSHQFAKSFPRFLGECDHDVLVGVFGDNLNSFRLHINYNIIYDKSYISIADKFNQILEDQRLNLSQHINVWKKMLNFPTKSLLMTCNHREHFLEKSSCNFGFVTDKTAMCTVLSDHKAGSTVSACERKLSFEVNKLFEEYFGHTSESLLSELRDTIFGFLPLGANVICLLSTEEDLQKYVDIQSLPVHQLKCPRVIDKQGPWVVEAPAVSILNLETKEGIWKQFQEA
eukprot:snap_masked-scaffold_11-processed-gene-11.17-mRNA-1 protein AED:0.30 eAED:1.00 QI:0/0/0/0.5/1/1/2/0/336